MQSVSAPLSGQVVRPPAITLRVASDARLARLAAAGSEDAIAAIFERHHQALQRYCYSIVGNSHDAADALQNTMIKALSALPGETRQLALRPWLYRIAHNESISLLRARRPESDLDAAVNVSDAAASGAVESRERLDSLMEDLGELTERQRGALLLRELGGLEFAEVADAIGTTATAAKQSVYDARCALQALEAGRAMDCEIVRHTLSDGDRRMLRGMRMRGHLRACAGCRGFEAAMHQRPAQLTAMIPALPVASAAAMLHSILGGTGTGGGGGLAAGLAATAKGTAGGSVVAKAGAVVAVSAALAGGVVAVGPDVRAASPDRSTPHNELGIGADVRGNAPNAASAGVSLQSSRGSAAASAPRDGAWIQEATTSAEVSPPAPGRSAKHWTQMPSGPSGSAGDSAARPTGSGTSSATTGGLPFGADQSAGATVGAPSVPRESSGPSARAPSASGEPAATTDRRPPKAGKDAQKGGDKPPKAGKDAQKGGGKPPKAGKHSAGTPSGADKPDEESDDDEPDEESDDEPSDEGKHGKKPR